MFRKADEPKIRVLSCSQDLGLESGDTTPGLWGSLCGGEGVVSVLYFFGVLCAVVKEWLAYFTFYTQLQQW